MLYISREYGVEMMFCYVDFVTTKDSYCISSYFIVYTFIQFVYSLNILRRFDMNTYTLV